MWPTKTGRIGTTGQQKQQQQSQLIWKEAIISCHTFLLHYKQLGSQAVSTCLGLHRMLSGVPCSYGGPFSVEGEHATSSIFH